MKLSPFILITVVIGALSAILATLAIRDAQRQHSAETYPHVQGTILSSTVTTTSGSKGSVHYHPHVIYRYTVDGKEYTGDRYRYDNHSTSHAAAYYIVNSHPPGSAVDVYYNPADATDALLSPGVDSADILTCFIVAVVIIFLWLLPLKCGQQPGLPWTGPEETGGIKLITEAMVTRLRMPRYPPLSVAVVATGFLMCLAIVSIVTGLLSTPLWETGELKLAIVLISGAAVYAWQRMDVRSGKRDLVIDEAARTVQLPLTYGRIERPPIPISQIRSILLNKVRHRTKNGAYYTCMVTFKMVEGPDQKLMDLSLNRGESLGEWLKERLRLPERMIEPAEDAPL